MHLAASTGGSSSGDGFSTLVNNEVLVKFLCLLRTCLFYSSFKYWFSSLSSKRKLEEDKAVVLFA